MHSTEAEFIKMARWIKDIEPAVKIARISV
jgi:hypothetical protein